jgi:hypothetical protein
MRFPARIYACTLLALLAAGQAQGAVTTVLRYALGETGSLGPAHLPLDVTGHGYDLLAQINGAATTLVTDGLGAADSAVALHFNGVNQGFYGNGPDLAAAIGINNFGVELWVRTPNVTQEGYDFIFSLTSDTGQSTGPAIHLANGRWSASIPGWDWIGGNPFAAGGGVPAEANVWTRLAIVRNAGVFTLYVNGQAHAMTTGAAPVLMNGFHLAVNPGGAVYFEGDIDEVRVFNFAPGAFNPNTDLYQLPITDFSGQAIINEIAASSAGAIEDADGTNSDWIELRNPTTASVQLSGWHLSDDPALPRKWTFPNTVLGPEQTLLVFASGKNRAVSGGELHTNFSLDPDGEFISLTRPDDSVASSFTFPKLKAGATFGLGRRLEATPITPTTPAKFKAMTDGSLGTSWTQPDFADGTWTSGAAAIGYDDGIDDGSNLQLQGYWKFDSASGGVAEDATSRGISGVLAGGATFTAAGAGHTGQPTDRALDLGNGSLGGYVVWNQAANGVFDAITTNNKFTLSIWTYGGANAPTQGYLFSMGSQTDGGGLRSAFAHLPWTDLNIYFDTGGCCGGDTRMYKNEPDTTKWKGQWNHYVFLKNGDQKEIWQNGQRWAIASNPAPITTIRSFLLGVSQGGLIDDLAVWAGALSAEQIQALYNHTAAPDGLNVFTPYIKQTVRSAMYGVTPSAMLRVPFTLASPPAWDELRLRLRYDDAFVAYLNGVEVARRNTPSVVSHNSLALFNRSKGTVLNAVADVNISAGIPLLRTNGQANVLAIHGLNESLTSPEFLIEPELVAYRYLPSRHFSPPTPLASNDAGYINYIADTSFTVNRGFYDTPQTTTITTPTPGTTLHYTLNGSIPGPANPQSQTAVALAGQSPSVSLTVSNTTVIRAMATQDDWMPTNIDTHTYLFANEIQAQPVAPAGVPTTWGVYGGYGPSIGQPMIADYAMDQRVVNGAVPGHTVRDGVLALPALCLSLPAADLFDATTGMYSNSPNQGPEWIRPASMELIYPDGSRANLQVPTGLRIHGGLGRQHWHTPKHSFSLLFKQRYGLGKFDYNLFEDTAVRQWDELVLRASSTDSFAVEYTGAYEYPNDRASYLRDPWMKDSFAAMGQPTGHHRYVNLFLNGLYWGQYNLAEAYVESWHEEMFGGTKEEYDVVKDVNELESGTRTDWDAALAMAAAGFPDDAAFYRIQGCNPDGSRNPAYPVYIDMPNLIDFMILHIYATARDWPVHNWWGGRRRGPLSKGFLFYPWDQEITNLNLAWINTYSGGARFEEVDSDGTPAAFYAKLRLNPRFQRQFGDRVQALCFNQGALTPAACDLRWKRLQAQIDHSIVAECARWGDARQATPHTREANWLPEMNWVSNTWWSGNHPQALNRFRSVSLFPTLVAPTMSPQLGGTVAAGMQIMLTAPGGPVYYTLDGTEPILLTGAIAPTALAFAGPITINADTVVNARVLNAGSTSALTVGTFVIAQAASALNLVISELHYHPADGGYEFIEFMNVGTQTIDLGGVTLTNAVSLTFPLGTKLTPGERVIVTEADALVPGGIRTVGSYVGKLGNGGETLTVSAANGSPILSITYSDLSPWPAAADGLGSSLTLIRPTTRPNSNATSNWRASATSGGTPGITDATAFSGTAAADADQDGLSALLEYALGTSDASPTPSPPSSEFIGESIQVSLTTNSVAEDVLLEPEMSTTLTAWDPILAAQQTISATDVPGQRTITWLIPAPTEVTRLFIRFKASQITLP